MNANELADADDVIHKLQSWSEAYPTDIFPEITEQDIEYINAVNPNLSARFFAHVGRHFIKKGFEPALVMLRQQQAEIEALKDFAIWMTGCGYDFCQHEYFIKCRDELLIGKAQEK